MNKMVQSETNMSGTEVSETKVSEKSWEACAIEARAAILAAYPELGGHPALRIPVCGCGYVFDRVEAMQASKAAHVRGDNDWRLLCPMCSEVFVIEDMVDGSAGRDLLSRLKEYE